MVWAALAAGAAVGGFIQALTGFGAAVIIVIVMSFFMSIQTVPALSSAICLFLSVGMTFRCRKSIRFRQVLWPTAIADVISLLIISRVSRFPVDTLKLIFGVFLILLALYFYFFADKVMLKKPGTAVMIGCSGLSGVTAGLFSISGPTMALYFLAASDDGDSYVANLQCHFLITNILIMAGRTANGFLTPAMLPMVIVGTMAVFAGVYAGERARRRLSGDKLRRVVYAAVGLSGLTTVLQQLM